MSQWYFWFVGRNLQSGVIHHVNAGKQYLDSCAMSEVITLFFPPLDLDTTLQSSAPFVCTKPDSLISGPKCDPNKTIRIM
jgi:hypothetical protein